FIYGKSVEGEFWLFTSQIEGLTTYQMNFLRAVCAGHHSDFTSKALSSLYDLGAKSNVSRIKNALIDKELIDTSNNKVVIADPVFRLWFGQNCM
ncbi:MAG: hypothetical protein KBT29_04460, partial [Prevotellaceae bacterium]|nr:hypothetical protein [Candidatus Minthosoma caballi]